MKSKRMVEFELSLKDAQMQCQFEHLEKAR